MLTPCSLADCPGLIDLMLTSDEHGASFVLKNVECSVQRVGDAAYLKAVSPEFSFSAVYPGWYVGEHHTPAQVAIVGDAIACTRWLPLHRGDKLAIIDCLPLGTIDRTLCSAAA